MRSALLTTAPRRAPARLNALEKAAEQDEVATEPDPLEIGRRRTELQVRLVEKDKIRAVDDGLDPDGVEEVSGRVVRLGKKNRSGGSELCRVNHGIPVVVKHDRRYPLAVHQCPVHVPVEAGHDAPGHRHVEESEIDRFVHTVGQQDIPWFDMKVLCDLVRHRQFQVPRVPMEVAGLTNQMSDRPRRWPNRALVGVQSCFLG